MQRHTALWDQHLSEGLLSSKITLLQGILLGRTSQGVYSGGKIVLLSCLFIQGQPNKKAQSLFLQSSDGAWQLQTMIPTRAKSFS